MESPAQNPSQFDTPVNGGEQLLVNQRELNDAEVRLVNHVIKTRAARYVASTCQDDLFPETAGQLPAWCQIDKLFHSRFPSMRGRSETLIRYADDSILYTNAFGERDLTPSWFVRSRERDQAAPTKDKV
jgi:Ser/Thr protein kinase RdoA (MazF antagonist)